jgi:uncharacterized membrane protein YccC
MATGGLWTLFNAWLRRHRVSLRLSLRITIAALLTLAFAQILKLPLPLWAVLTAVIVTQMSVGRSLKATVDYLAGTLGGAVYGGAIAVLVPHANEIGLLAVLALCVAPLALIAAVKPSLNVAPITAIIVLLVPTMTHVGPIASAVDRVLEVALGGATGFVVSFLLLPSSAYALALEAAARTLDHMARAAADLLAGATQGLDVDALHRIQDGIGDALVQLGAISSEAERERAARLVTGPDTASLLRTLLRLRHDLVMIGRAAGRPMPEALRPRLQAPLAQIASAAADHLHASGAALLARREPPPLKPVEMALDVYAAELAALRREGLTRSLSDEDVESVFALGFALEQLRQEFSDLEWCIAQWR